MTKSYSKLKRYSDLKNFDNVIEKEDNNYQNKIRRVLKQNAQNILEVACGYGEYTIDMAKSFSNKTFIGLDIKGDRIWKGAKIAFDQNIENAYFFRGYIESVVEYFPQDSFDEIWLTFPDPHPRKKEMKKRITTLNFLDKYSKILKPNGILHLKTDSTVLYVYSIFEIKRSNFEIIQNISKINFESIEKDSILNIPTRYEKRAKSRSTPIKYIQAQSQKN